jgi:hypothetical protein
MVIVGKERGWRVEGGLSMQVGWSSTDFFWVKAISRCMLVSWRRDGWVD